MTYRSFHPNIAVSHDGTIDLLLTDVTMPDVNGWELSQNFAAQRPNMKVVFMSGYAQDVLEAGVTESEHGFSCVQFPNDF